MGRGYRSKRLGELIRQEISSMFYQGLKDPRLHSGIISLLEVQVDSELNRANIYVSILDKDKADEVMKAFASANGYIRRELAKRLSVRQVPELVFHHDTTIEEGLRLRRIIDDLNTKDEQDDSAT